MSLKHGNGFPPDSRTKESLFVWIITCMRFQSGGFVWAWTINAWSFICAHKNYRSSLNADGRELWTNRWSSCFQLVFFMIILIEWSLFSSNQNTAASVSSGVYSTSWSTQLVRLRCIVFENERRNGVRWSSNSRFAESFRNVRSWWKRHHLSKGVLGSVALSSRLRTERRRSEKGSRSIRQEQGRRHRSGRVYGNGVGF